MSPELYKDFAFKTRIGEFKLTLESDGIWLCCGTNAIGQAVSPAMAAIDAACIPRSSSPEAYARLRQGHEPIAVSNTFSQN